MDMLPTVAPKEAGLSRTRPDITVMVDWAYWLTYSPALAVIALYSAWQPKIHDITV